LWSYASTAEQPPRAPHGAARGVDLLGAHRGTRHRAPEALLQPLAHE
jgi:hypothetical protein